MVNLIRNFRKPKESALPLFDEAFLRRLERLNFRTVPSLRGGMVGERRSRNLRPALDFSDHRPYTAGDDLRHVDWNAYARQEELFVKLGEATQSVNVHILLDCSRSMNWQATQFSGIEGRAAGLSKWDSARRLAGAMAYLGLASGEQVAITSFSHGLNSSFGPTRGKRRVIPALQFLTGLAPVAPPRQPADAGLARSLATYAHTHSRGGLFILVSDLLDAAASPDTGRGADWLVEGLSHLTPPRWQVVVVHFMSEQELHPTFTGDYDLQDMETGESLPFHLDEHTLSQYRLRIRRWCAELQSVCLQRAATYARVMAEWPFERALVPYLRQRGVIQ